MRVLHVVHNYPPEFRGGVERYVERLCADLPGLGWDPVVLAGSEEYAEAPQVTEEETHGVRVLRLRSGPGLRNPVDAFDAGTSRVYEEVLTAVAPDLVHVHHWWNLSDDLVRRAVARDIPTVLTLHDFFSTCSLFFRMPDGVTPCDQPQDAAACAPCVAQTHPIEPLVVQEGMGHRAQSYRDECKAAGAVLTPSRSHAENVRRFLGGDVDVRVVPLGSAPCDPVEPEGQAFPDAPLRVLHFGNLGRVKGTDLLVEAARRVDPTGERILLTLAGDNVDGLDLEGPGVRLSGSYDQPGLRRLAASSDLAAFPSLARETYGLAVDEALRLGLPVVVSDRGALAERVGDRGVVIPGGDVGAMERVLRELLEEPRRLAVLRDAPLPALEDAADHAKAVAAVYDSVRSLGRPTVDVHGPLLQRLESVARLVAQLPAASLRATDDVMTDASTTIHRTVEPDDTGQLVSVIIRTHNRKEMLREALESVAAQTWPHREAVVCNDGGEDVRDVVDPFKGRLEITYLTPGGVGRCVAANHALENARGTWVSWLDDDDRYLPEHLETLVSAATAGGHRVVYSDSWRVMVTAAGDGGWSEVSRDQPHPQRPFERRNLVGGMPFHLVSLMQHRETVDAVGGFDPALEVLEDMDLVYRLAQAYDLERVPETTAEYRIRDDESNAVTSMKREFIETRSELLRRYGHVAVPSLVEAMRDGEDAIAGLHARISELEAMVKRLTESHPS